MSSSLLTLIGKFPMAYLKLLLLIGFMVILRLFFSLLLLLLWLRLLLEEINLMFPVCVRSFFLNLISSDNLFELFRLDLVLTEIFEDPLCEFVRSFSDLISFVSWSLSLFHPKSGRKSSFLGVLLASSLFLFGEDPLIFSSSGILASFFCRSWKKESTYSLEILWVGILWDECLNLRFTRGINLGPNFPLLFWARRNALFPTLFRFLP